MYCMSAQGVDERMINVHARAHILYIVMCETVLLCTLCVSCFVKLKSVSQCTLLYVFYVCSAF